MLILENPDDDLRVSEDILEEEKIIEVLAEKVQAYLDCNINLLMSYLYRLDVLEYKIKDALSNSGSEPGNVVLAKLIWERQKQRISTKKKYSTERTIEEELAW